MYKCITCQCTFIAPEEDGSCPFCGDDKVFNLQEFYD